MRQPSTTTPLTLRTTIARLLEQHPQLEDLLVAQAPAFKRLKHPILRRTVARVATIEQAAQMGGLDPGQLLATLRVAAGQAAAMCDDAAAEQPQVLAAEPDWAAARPQRRRIDADALLDTGATPFKTVLAEARTLGATELLEVAISFRPTPMLRLLEKAGFRTALVIAGPERYLLLVAPAGD